MKVSIFDLEKVKAEVARRQNDCHEAGVSYVAFDKMLGVMVEYTPNGFCTPLAPSEKIPKRGKTNPHKNNGAIITKRVGSI